MIAREVNVPPVVPPVEDITVRVAVAPSVPTMVAVIVVVPVVSAVASPEALMVATAGVLDDQVTWLVTFSVVAGWLP